MHHSGMQVTINAQLSMVISYDGIKGKKQTTHVMLTVVPTSIDGD